MTKGLGNWRVGPHMGLFFVIAPTVMAVCLSAIGERLPLVVATAIAGTLLCLLGGLSYLRPTRTKAVLRQKRYVIIASLVVLLSVPLTLWPLHLMFWGLRPTLVRAAYAAAEDKRNAHALFLQTSGKGLCGTCFPWLRGGGGTLSVQKRVGPFWIPDAYVAERQGSIFLRTKRGTFYVHRAGLELPASYYPKWKGANEILLDQNFIYRY